MLLALLLPKKPIIIKSDIRISHSICTIHFFSSTHTSPLSDNPHNNNNKLGRDVFYWFDLLTKYHNQLLISLRLMQMISNVVKKLTQDFKSKWCKRESNPDHPHREPGSNPLHHRTVTYISSVAQMIMMYIFLQ